nr:hypothetical protein [Tanacetum cinerariifolium]
MFHKKYVDFAVLILEDFSYQIDNRQLKKSRREIMPYPKFTKVIINHFLSINKYVPKALPSGLHTIKDDGVLSRMNFVRIGEDVHKYGCEILDEMLTDAIKQSETYKAFINYSTGLVPPKKTRESDDEETDIELVHGDEYVQDDVDEEIKMLKLITLGKVMKILLIRQRKMLKSQKKKRMITRKLNFLHQAPAYLALYDALMLSMIHDEDDLDRMFPDQPKLKKRDHANDKDKDPSARPNQGKKTKGSNFNKSLNPKGSVAEPIEESDDEETDIELVHGDEYVQDDVDEEIKNAEVNNTRKGDEDITDTTKANVEKSEEEKDDNKKAELPSSSSSLSVSLGVQAYKKHQAHRALYDALMLSMIHDEDDLDRMFPDQPKQKKRDHANDKDEDPSARPNQGSNFNQSLHPKGSVAEPIEEVIMDASNDDVVNDANQP